MEWATRVNRNFLYWKCYRWLKNQQYCYPSPSDDGIGVLCIYLFIENEKMKMKNTNSITSNEIIIIISLVTFYHWLDLLGIFHVFIAIVLLLPMMINIEKKQFYVDHITEVFPTKSISWHQILSKQCEVQWQKVNHFERARATLDGSSISTTIDDCCRRAHTHTPSTAISKVKITHLHDTTVLWYKIYMFFSYNVRSGSGSSTTFPVVQEVVAATVVAATATDNNVLLLANPN